MHVLLVIRNPRAAADAARALRRSGITVDVAMDTNIAAGMIAEGNYTVVVCDSGSALRLTPPAKLLEIDAANTSDPQALATSVRALADGP